jgi:hypothetical protein
MSAKHQRVILIDHGDGTTEYRITHGPKDLKDLTDKLKADPSVEYYEVVKAKSVELWANPNCCMED